MTRFQVLLLVAEGALATLGLFRGLSGWLLLPLPVLAALAWYPVVEDSQLAGIYLALASAPVLVGGAWYARDILWPPFWGRQHDEDALGASAWSSYMWLAVASTLTTCGAALVVRTGRLDSAILTAVLVGLSGIPAAALLVRYEHQRKKDAPAR